MMSKKKTILLGILVAALIVVAVWRLHIFPVPVASESAPAATSIDLGSRIESEPEVEELPDFTAWLIFPGTDIDSPVMQTVNNEYYIRRNEKGEIDTWGCYFADFECSSDSQNYIVYGHSLDNDSDGQRFTQLKKLNESKFAEKYHRIQLVIDGEVREYEIFSSGYANIYTGNDIINANPDRHTQQINLDAAIARSRYNYGVEVTDKDDILTLCTCTSNYVSRYVVMAKQVDVSTAENFKPINTR